MAESKKNRLILGLMTFGPDESAGARITSLEEYKSCLDAWTGAGYNEVDTARMYVEGAQEAFTREAGWQARGLSIATKLYPTPPHHSHEPAALRATLLESLRQLGTERVDIFYLHAPDRRVPFADTLAELDKLHREGRFARLGLSNFAAFEVAEVVMLCVRHGWVRPTIYQGRYNAISRNVEDDLFPCLRRYGIDFVGYNPVAGGLFSGKYSARNLESTPESGRFSNVYQRAGDMYRKRYFHPAIFEALGIIEPVAAKHGLTLIETALRWMVHHSQLHLAQAADPAARGNDGIILGVSSQAQLEQNIEDLEKGPLPQELVEALDKASRVAKQDIQHYWHGELKYTYDTLAATSK